ncbi:flagellar basal body protein [Shimia sp. CNT1-13L.2]|uniref:flagellar basal body protein n=1 Tax=Shimia sp. CNT1-13L.2 TaxID=2959663 RepID=UPI0020CD0007|nr:flagellar basal body protein [Shimia sp. CNT1-13L.2]MCP9481068.1 flagellar basal body protein [Shimia sp. CNT1-13L.2]
MNFGDVNLFDLASKRLQWLSDRQKVLSENIANADTAEYRARDVESFQSYLSNTEDTSLPLSAQIVETKTAWGEDFSGNNVVLEEQMMEAGSTSGQYKMAAGLYKKAHQLILAVSGN